MQCNHQCQTEDDTDGWFPALMVCNVEPMNATLFWTRDGNTTNASYTVLYEDATGNEFRSDPVSLSKFVHFACLPGTFCLIHMQSIKYVQWNL